MRSPNRRGAKHSTPISGSGQRLPARRVISRFPIPIPIRIYFSIEFLVISTRMRLGFWWGRVPGLFFAVLQLAGILVGDRQDHMNMDCLRFMWGWNKGISQCLLVLFYIGRWEEKCIYFYPIIIKLVFELGKAVLFYYIFLQYVSVKIK